MATVVGEKVDVLSASTMIGDKVVNGGGESLGDIKELMVDVQEGRIAYAVLSFGGFMGMGDKLFAIPWSALSVDTIEKRFVFDVKKELRKRGVLAFGMRVAA